MMCFTSPSETPTCPTKGNFPETAFAMNLCLRVSKQLTAQDAANMNTDAIIKQIEMIMKSPLCMPRYFFQVLQNTSIKLSLTPQARTAGEPIIVQSGHNLVVKIEGVIQNFTKIAKPFRKIDSVQLTLVSQLISQRPNDVKPTNDTLTLTQTVRPHKDFLSGNFLVSLNNVTYLGGNTIFGGQWQVTLEACIIDENGVVWNSGPKSTLIVRVPEESKQNVSAVGFGRRY
jgi:integrator complex subunit 7